MAERVHPRESSSDRLNTTEPSDRMEVNEKRSSPPPPTGTYVVQIPKDQIYRVPPPENAQRYQKYAHRKSRRNPCCCCICWILSIIFLLIILVAIAVGIFYFIVRPKIPNYTVVDLSIKGINLTSSSSSDLTFSPEFDVTVRAENPNKKIGIYYEKGSSVVVSHSNVNLCSGVLPDFYQPKNNVTVFQAALKGSGVKLTTLVYDDLLQQQKKGRIPIEIDLKVPVKIKVGSLKKTWKIIVKVNCEITVNKLASDSKIVSKDCGVKVKPW